MTVRPARRQPLPPVDSAEARIAALVALAYELLDAHADTAQLQIGEAGDAEWDNHLAYLTDLQRVGRETMARVASSPSGVTSSPS